MGECELGYKCIFCKKPIPDAEIPDEVHKKLGMQIVWHQACHPDNQ